MNLSRRHFFLGSLALPVLSEKMQAQKKKGGETPNILLVMVDNLPAWMLGCYGNKEVRTPAVDRLAQTGTRFLNHFACSPMPGPARASLLTGRTQVQLKDADAPGEPTLDKLLQAAGYACQTTTGGTAAVGFIDAQTGSKPFLLTAAFSDFAPPYAIGAKFLDGYLPAKFDTFAQVPAASNIARDKEMFGGNLLPSLRKAAAAATALDAEVGALVAALSRKKLLDNTLIIFTAPTGSLLGRHGLWGGGDASDPVNFYDEAIATPMIWSWPARIVPLGVRPEMVSAVDLVPTLCDLTPADLPDKNFTGRSYLPLVQHKPLPKKQPWRQTVFASWRDAGVARDDRYKLILREGKGPNELYDVKVDPRERINQFDNPQFLTIKTQLTGELARWRKG
jgi:arylsulfatase A-like enzyme